MLNTSTPVCSGFEQITCSQQDHAESEINLTVLSKRSSMSWRHNNLPRNRRGKKDIGGFETTASAYRQQNSREASSSTFGEDSISKDRRRIKRVKLDVPAPPSLQRHADPPLPAFPDANFDNVEDLQWQDNAPLDLEDEIDDDDDDLEDGAQKARRYASSVRPARSKIYGPC